MDNLSLRNPRIKTRVGRKIRAAVYIQVSRPEIGQFNIVKFSKGLVDIEYMFEQLDKIDLPDYDETVQEIIAELDPDEFEGADNYLSWLVLRCVFAHPEYGESLRANLLSLLHSKSRKDVHIVWVVPDDRPHMVFMERHGKGVEGWSAGWEADHAA